MTLKELARANIGALEARLRFLDEASENADHEQWAFVNMAIPLERTELTYWKGILDD